MTLSGETERSGNPRIRCRQIEPADLASVVSLLHAAFPERSAAYWERGLARLAARELPPGVPRFGYVLDRDGELVGVLLTIYAAVSDGAGTHLRCNLSSWYVAPEIRALGTLLDGQAMRDRSVTYLNVSPAPHTIGMHEARGFRRFCRGQMLAVPALGRPRRGASVRALGPTEDVDLPEPPRALVRDHAGYGCLCLLCRDGAGSHVVILQRLSLKLSRRHTWLPRLPALQMVYGPAASELPRWLGAIGRHLLLRGEPPFLLLDVDARPPGIVGRHLDGWRPRYARGPHPVPVGDLSYTEITVFGP